MNDLPLRSFRASNPGPFTLDGTRSWLVGRTRPALVDPGPNETRHLERLVDALSGATHLTILLTHGHGDHAGGLDHLMGLLDSGPGPELAVDVRGAGHDRARPLSAGEGVETDAGLLVAVPTPGHTRDHLGYHWPAAGAFFAGDHLLGRGDTTWVAGYRGCVADYLESIERLRELDLSVIHPGHGPSLTDPAAALDRFEAHRRERIAQVRLVLARRPAVSDDELLEAVYGDTVPADLRGAALESLRALREFVDERDR